MPLQNALHKEMPYNIADVPRTAERTGNALRLVKDTCESIRSTITSIGSLGIVFQQSKSHFKYHILTIHYVGGSVLSCWNILLLKRFRRTNMVLVFLWKSNTNGTLTAGLVAAACVWGSVPSI